MHAVNAGYGPAPLSPTGPVGATFLASPAPARGLVGPMQSGKKTTASVDIILKPYRYPTQTQWRCALVAPGADAIDKIMQTVHRLIRGAGRSETTGIPRIIVPLNDRNETTFAELDLFFFNLDDRQHRCRLATFETTSACLLDARALPEEVFNDALSAIGSYPLERGGPQWAGVTAVSRMPIAGHWLIERSGEGGDLALFRQPGGRTPEAENKDALAKLGISYDALARRMSAERVRTEIDAEIGSSAAETAAEAVRAVARNSLREFIRLMMPDIEPAKHHELIIDRLEKVARGEIKRLMLFLPPGSAKSTYASVLFPPWFMGNHPALPVIAASHSKELAERFGRRVRNIVGSPMFKEIFGFGLSGDSGAAGRWETARCGEYFAVGVDASVTGRRAALGIIDDPVKGRSEADSPTVRQHAWDWYKADFWTRLIPNAPVIYIGTRWHDDDLAGRLLEEAKNGGEQWEVVSLPAIAGEDDPLGRAPGDRLWPEWYTPEMFATAQRDARNWSALYQQNPMPESGDYFRAEWIQWYDNPPPREQLRTYGASDYATKAGAGDFTVHLVAGMDPAHDLYLLELWRDRTATDQWIEALLDLMERWKTITWAEEKGQITGSVGPFITRRQYERRVYGARRQFTSASDKSARAQAFRGRCAMGKVYLPRKAPWAVNLMQELLRFPAGTHDDQVDACSLIGRMLDEMVPGTAAKPSASAPAARPEFFIAQERGIFVKRVRISTPGVIVPTVVIQNVTEAHKERWPQEYQAFVDAVHLAEENGTPLPGFDGPPSVSPDAELPRLGVALEAPAITFNLLWSTAPGTYLDPYAKRWPRRL